MFFDGFRSLAEGVARREYSLLLGAGSSAGLVGSDGGTLGGADALKEEILRTFDLPSEPQDLSLQRAFSAAGRRDPEGLLGLLLRRFTEVAPGWQVTVPDFGWQRVWTLNIDDSVENAYSSKGGPSVPLSWRASSARRQTRGAVEIVHLHGSVREILDDAGAQDVPATELLDYLIFSWPQYGHAAHEARVWHQRFRDELVDKPFLIIGARIVDEVDFFEILQSRNVSQEKYGLPSVVVLKTVDPLDREELEAMGLVVVEASADEFMNELSAEVSRVLSEEFDISSESVPHSFMVFMSQFQNMRLLHPDRGVDRNEFYKGWDPDWFTILSEADAPIELTEFLAKQVIDDANAETPQQKMYLLHGGPGAGKSTGLLRLAAHVRGSGLTPWLFRGDQALDPESWIDWLRNNPRGVFFIDDCADFAEDIDVAGEAAAKAGLTLIVVGAVRENRRDHTLKRMSGAMLVNELKIPLEYGQLTNRDINSLLQKLDQATRLGRLTRRSRDEQFMYFSHEHRGRLFDAMANLEGEQGFIRRLTGAYADIPDVRSKRLLGAAALAYNFGIPLRISAASAVSGLSSGQVTTAVAGPLAGMLLLDRGGVRPPHRVTSAIYLNNVLDPGERFDLALGILTSIAPQVDRQAIISMSKEHRLARQILEHENVIWLVGADRSRTFFEALEPDYGWNARYWDQRALLENKLLDPLQARSYAEQSVKLHPHAFGFTTLGKILMTLAESGGHPTDLRDAAEALRQARDWRTRRWEIDEHPFSVFFSGVVGFAKRWGLAAVPADIRSQWQVWDRRGHELRSGKLMDEIEYWNREWLSLQQL